MKPISLQKKTEIEDLASRSDLPPDVLEKDIFVDLLINGLQKIRSQYFEIVFCGGTCFKTSSSSSYVLGGAGVLGAPSGRSLNACTIPNREISKMATTSAPRQAKKEMVRR